MRALLCCAAILAALPAFADNWSKQWTVSGSPELRVDAGDGRVSVTVGSGNRIEADIVTNGWRIAPDEVSVTAQQNGNRVEIDVRVPKRHFDWGGRSHHIEVNVRVPRETSSSIHTGDGSITIRGVHGHTEATSGDGSIEALEIDGGVKARTGDGHVRVSGRLDELNVETGDGSVEAEITAGSHLNSDWRVHSGDGYVNLRVPEDLRANLSAHTGDGSIVVTLPVTTDAGGSQRHDLRAAMNGGGPAFTIQTGDGSIHIDRN